MKKKVPDLKRIPLISNPIDWKGFVPDKAQLMKNIESAVDNQVQNIIIGQPPPPTTTGTTMTTSGAMTMFLNSKTIIKRQRKRRTSQ